MEITIRKAVPEDAYDYTICHISCFQSAYKGIVADDYLNNMLAEKEQRVERYKKNLTDPGDCKYYCVMNAERMIGFLIINISRAADQSGVGEIWAIYLVEEFRNKGYGKEMLDFAINELRLVEPKEIFLWVLEENNRARRFYEKHSFSFDGTKREVKYGKPLVQLRYVLNL
jgi:ribosomal protein S18 acetylase RimI-like enzyme